MKHKIIDLENQINEAEYAYRVLDNPIISDEVFDHLKKELKILSEAYPEFVTSNSPLKKIGIALTDGFKKVKHKSIMGSIENTYEHKELIEWAKKIARELHTSIDQLKFILDDKYDGISGSLIYNNGLLTTATTRGDGEYGDDITNNAKMCWNIPLDINNINISEIRGEFVIFKDDLERINQLESADYKNVRNLVSGTMKSLNSEVIRNRFVHFIPFQFFDLDGNEMDIIKSYHTRQLFNIQTVHTSGDIYYIIEALKDRESVSSEMYFRNRKFLIDGAVVKVYDIDHRKTLGYSSSCPNWARAFKYSQEKAITKVLNITWQVGRNKITPVAELEPVQLEGTTVSRATIHNITQLKRLNIAIGDSVEIEKAGFIIPYINKVTQKSENEYSFPSNCPCCKAPTKVIKIESEELTCTNDFCPAKLVSNTIYLVKSLNIAEIGSSVIKELVDKKIIKTHFDILSLKYETIMTLDRMGKTKANKIYNNIQKGLVQPLNKVIQCIAISSLGESNSEKIANKFQSFNDFLNTNVSDLLSIENIGESTANNIMEYISKNKEILHKLKDTFVIRVEEGFSEKLKGEKIVITGAATKSRDELEAMVKKNGGEISNSVSKKTTTVIIGSKEPANYKSSKKTKAIELNIPIVDEFWLFDKIGVDEEIAVNKESTKPSDVILIDDIF